MIERVNIIGAGNVATHLLSKLSHTCKISSIFSRDFTKAAALAQKVKGVPIDNLKAIDLHADLTIIAVKDDAIVEVLSQLPKSLPIVHTSGSRGVEVMQAFANYGILYPLQTFSKNRPLEIGEIPFFIEASSSVFLEKIERFCKTHLSENVSYSDSHKRSVIHLAAVFASNFTNHLLTEAQCILDTENIPLSVLEPLMLETIQKAFALGPKITQTGPAARSDQKVIDKQIATLKEDDLKSIYELISKRIAASVKSNA